jgi:UV DNA damage endonuclease
VRLGTGPRLLSRPALRTHDGRLPFAARHLSASLVCLRDLLAHAARSGITFYRMASQLLPILLPSDLDGYWRQLDECQELAACLGREARAAGVRLTVHPVLDIQLGSDDEALAQRGTCFAAAWAALFERLGGPEEGCIVVHLGGAGPRAAARFARAVDGLPEGIRLRLALENDERHCSLETALSLARQTGVPVVWDYLHWRCLNPEGRNGREAFAHAAATWAGPSPAEVHFSSPRTATSKGRAPLARQHAEYIDPFAFIGFLGLIEGEADCDVMLEATAKDLALAKLRRDLRRLGHPWGEAEVEHAAVGAAGGR